LQKLAFSKMKLGMLRETLTGGEQLETLDNIHEHVSTMFKDMRSLTFDLCPPVLYDIGLEAALREWLQREAADKHGLAVSLETEGEAVQLKEELRVALYRATREVLINVVKHAQAHSVGVTLVNLNGTVRIEVRDDGIGFERSRADKTREPSAGLGLFTVRERLEYLGGSLYRRTDQPRRICQGEGRKMSVTILLAEVPGLILEKSAVPGGAG
ncbi:MAG: sensor histidine kinase, partial [Planctomycetota bacterium]